MEDTKAVAEEQEAAEATEATADACLMTTVEELRCLLEELASTRPDVQTPSCRQARIQCAVEALTRDDEQGEGARQLLASIGAGA